MKQVTIENVKARIALLEGTERACGLTLKGEFELACLRQLADSMGGVDDDVRNVVALLANNEWAEHCTKTVLGSRLETEITRLVGRVRPAPVSVPDEIRLLQSEVTIWKDRWELLRELFREVADALGCDVKDQEAMLNKIDMLKGAEPSPATDNTAQQFEALATSNANDCLWSYDSHQGTWHGKCGVYWVFMDDGPDENGMKFCPGCGKPVATTSAGGGNP